MSSSARVSHVEGKTISSVNTSVETYTIISYILKKERNSSKCIPSTSHTLSNNDTIAVSDYQQVFQI